ncbi:MFS transporter [Methylomonas sp. EbA]|uniref:MFS transporter n=2 Tax=Methylomonas albis TaxID=1854563 RepID=A0ABR9D1M8_9GAMM|nr:MFS transporter [Methylomonas albis]
MVLMPLGAELMRDFAIGPARFGSLVGVYTLASALTSLVGSRWIDHGDRKRSLLVLYAGFIMATFSCGFAAHFDALLAARALAGACAGLSNATMMAMIADRVAPERRGQAMGTIASAFGACAVIGVPVGLSLAAVGGWRIPFFVVAALAGLWWLWLLRFLPKSPAVMTEGQGSLRSPALALGWLLSFCIVFAGFLIVPYLGTHLNGTLGVSMSQLSWIYLGAGLTTWVAAQFVGRAVDRFGAAGVLAVLLAASTVPHLWFTQLQTEPLWLISLVFVLFMVLTSTRAIPASVWLIGRVPPPLRGRYMAVNTASTEAASGLAAWCAGLMIGSGQGGAVQHFERVGWLAAGVSCLSLGLLAGLVAKTRVPTGKTSGSHPKVCNAES